MTETYIDNKDNDRYKNLEKILEMVYELATVNRYEGLSIKDMQAQFGISRSTVLRMKKVIDRVFGLEETPQSQLGREKKWYLSSRHLKNIISIRPEEFAQLEVCKDILKNSGHFGACASIEKLIDKLNIITNKKISEIDIEALLSSQGYAIRQTPKINIPFETLEKFSYAIIAFKCVTFDYPSSKGGVRRVKVEPYGIVYGTNVNLLAHNVNDETGVYKYYTLAKMSNVRVLEENYYQDENFSLQEYLKNSFGIYQEKEPINVKLKFDKSVAQSVLNYSFHPSQQIEQQENGDVIVTFHACGTKEMCWHFFTWGNNCQVLEPQSLKDEYRKLLTEALQTTK